MDDWLHDLCQKVVNLVILNEFLVPVTVTQTQTDADGITAVEHAMLIANANAAEVKEVLRKRLGIKKETPVELRLCTSNEAVSKQHVFGTFETMPPPAATKLQVQVVPFDPCLQGLFEATGMGAEEERDEMMERMMQGRAPRNCPGNHSLPEEQPSAISAQRHTVMRCSKCVRIKAYTGRGCRICNFALCASCLHQDAGLLTTTPYQGVRNIAEGIRKELVLEITENWKSQQEMTRISWKPEWGEIQPRLFTQTGGVWAVNGALKVLPPGVHLIVRLSEELREIVGPLYRKDLRLPIKKRKMLFPGEMDEILSNGATLLDLRKIFLKLEESECWKMAKREVESRQEVIVRLVSFEAHRVSFEFDYRQWFEFEPSFGGVLVSDIDEFEPFIHDFIDIDVDSDSDSDFYVNLGEHDNAI